MFGYDFTLWRVMTMSPEAVLVRSKHGIYAAWHVDRITKTTVCYTEEATKAWHRQEQQKQWHKPSRHCVKVKSPHSITVPVHDGTVTLCIFNKKNGLRW